jgi:uncharacterized protein (TIGR02145 family)
MCDKGEFTDSRDGQKYRTVKIGGLVWMAENLNFEVDDYGSYRYGRLYTWEAAKFACPAGWHLPSCEEWAVLVNAAGGWKVAGKHLKSKTGWYGESGIENLDTYGFSALPGGYEDPHEGMWGPYYAFWWTATESEYYSEDAWFLCMSYDNDYVHEDDKDKRSHFSVRCILD